MPTGERWWEPLPLPNPEDERRRAAEGARLRGEQAAVHDYVSVPAMRQPQLVEAWEAVRRGLSPAMLRPRGIEATIVNYDEERAAMTQERDTNPPGEPHVSPAELDQMVEEMRQRYTTLCERRMAMSGNAIGVATSWPLPRPAEPAALPQPEPTEQIMSTSETPQRIVRLPVPQAEPPPDLTPQQITTAVLAVVEMNRKRSDFRIWSWVFGGGGVAVVAFLTMGIIAGCFPDPQDANRAWAGTLMAVSLLTALTACVVTIAVVLRETPYAALNSHEIRVQLLDYWRQMQLTYQEQIDTDPVLFKEILAHAAKQPKPKKA